VSKSTQHIYEVIEVWGDRPGIEVGGHLVDRNHVRKHHEPERTWEFLDLSKKVDSGEGFSGIVGKHIGEYEKVKHLLTKEEAS